MPANGNRDEARDRAVSETLDLIDKLDADQARSVLRCFAIDEENFDSRALATIATTVFDTCYKTRGDCDALCHFPDGETARLNREHLLEALAASAEAERAAQQVEAEEQAQKTAQSSRPSENVPNVETSSTNGQHGHQMDGAADFPAPDLGDLEFEKLEIRRLIRDGHVTINNYYMNKAPEAQPEQKPEQKPLSHLCALCNHQYFEKDNVPQEDGKGPCRYHHGRLVGAPKNKVSYTLRSHVAGEVWNCCRRKRNEKGCHPGFHKPA